mmetsp:Transcript_30952/g.45484  ORF Transcript_30952/g.45484 Transcript_30952/m.45484 type:complete len:340 (+) Transcript_30952:1-1020(+)
MGFADEPNYELIQSCLKEFLPGNKSGEEVAVDEEVARLVEQEDVSTIDWNFSFANKRSKSTSRSVKKEEEEEIMLGSGGDGSLGPTWELLDTDDIDPLEAATLMDAEKEKRAAADAAATAAAAAAAANGNDGADASTASDRSTEATDLSRLPLPLQLRLAQVQYNARHPHTIPVHIALRDWMELAVPLVYGVWNTEAFERGNHRTEGDGYRREVYEGMVQKCLDAAKPFKNFTHRSCFYHIPSNGEEGKAVVKKEEEEEENGQKQPKRRRILTTMRGLERRSSSPHGGGLGANSCLLAVSRVFFGLRAALDEERERKFAPPPALKFGSGMGVGSNSAMP